MPVFFAGTEEIFVPSWFFFEREGFFIFGIPGLGIAGFLIFDTFIKTIFIGINYDYEKSMKYSKFILPSDIFYICVF